ncbi:hypothetical protein Cgig2_032060 [Carnegiea gigantea]|uniref:Uncharacterized protein n=1 Tax=Carnegiea gigantea TaxID=171969 RepID=A0A9Q1JZ89_9CARY|nr:hypothetical protein Cgig2_032060 [Carnegiea gigantea]
MADTITHQVSEQVKRVMEAASLARPPPPSDYPLVHEGEPSHRLEGIPSPRPTERGREVSRSDRSGRPGPGQLRRRTAMESTGHPTQGTATGSATASTPYATHSRRTACWHIRTECQELNKVFHELADNEQIDRFLKRGPRFLRREQEPIPPSPQDEECSTEVVATIAGGYAEGITRSAWKAQLRSAQQVLTAEVQLITTKTKTKNKTNTNKTKGGEEKTRGGFYTSDSPSSSCSSSSEAPASVSRGLVASSSAISPSVEGGINSTSLGLRPSRAHPHSEGRPRSNCHPETHWPGSARPYGGTRGCQSGLAGISPPLLGPHKPRPSPADATALPSRSHGCPDPPAVFRSPVGTARRAPPAASTPQQPSPLERRPRPWLLLPRSPWGDLNPRSCQAPGLNYVLDKRELGGRVRLNERVGKGHWSLGSWLLQLGKGRGALAWLGCVPLMTGSPIGEGPIARLSPPPLAMGQRPRPHPAVPRSSAFSEPASSRRAQGRVPARKRLSLYISRENEQGRSDESGHVPYLLGLLSNKALPLLLPPAFGVSRHLFGSGVPGLEDHQCRPHLICIKQKGSQGWAKAYHPCVYKTGSSGRSSVRRSWVPRRGSARAFPHSSQGRPPNLIPNCFTFDFFSMAVMKPDLLLKQYHPKSLVSLGAFLTRVGAPGNSDPSATISVTAGVLPFRLSTDLPDPNDASEEEGLTDVLFEDELLEECLEEEPDEPVPEEALELVEATSAFGYGDLPRIRHLHLRAKDVRGGGILTAGPRGSARFKKGHCIGNLFGFPILILSGDASNHPTINKGWEIGELRVSTIHLGAGWLFRNGLGGRPTLNLPLGHLGSLGPPLHRPANKAMLPLVGSSCNLSKPQRLTTSNLPTMISYSWPYTREPRLARLSRSAAWPGMSPKLFQGAQTQPSHPRLRPTKSAGIIRGNLRERDEAGAKRSSNAR